MRTKSQVRREVEEKAAREQNARPDPGRDNRKYGGRDGGNYNDGGRRNDGRGGHNRKRSDFQGTYNEKPKQPMQQKKQSDDRKREGGQVGGSYGKGEREQRNHNRGGGNEQQVKKKGGQQVESPKKVEYEEIDEKTMATQLKQNFEQYCRPSEEEEEPEE